MRLSRTLSEALNDSQRRILRPDSAYRPGPCVDRAGFVGPATPWGWVGLVPLVIGLIGSCPLYAVLGIRTCLLSKDS
nr:DUF2892 domain-containing protein [Marimonas arenosa]